MEKINRWVAKHAILVYAVGIVLSMVLGSVVSAWRTGLACYLVVFVGIFLSAQWAFSRGDVLLREPIAHMERECDPFPYLEEAERQLQDPGPAHLKLNRRQTYATALLHAGKTEKALETMRSIPIKTTRGVGPAAKVTYYNNLMTAYWRLEMPEELENAYQNMLEHFASVKNKKERNFLQNIVDYKQAIMLQYHGAYAQARKAYTPNPQNRFAQVHDAWLMALIARGEGDIAQARKNLEFVIQNGNRLFVVEAAQALLTEINMEEQI